MQSEQHAADLASASVPGLTPGKPTDGFVRVEHEMDVVAAADWVIDLGPAGGDAGGQIVAVGTPAAVARSKKSRTAPYLAAVLGS